jgi:hypothetical protein
MCSLEIKEEYGMTTGSRGKMCGVGVVLPAQRFDYIIITFSLLLEAFWDGGGVRVGHILLNHYENSRCLNHHHHHHHHHIHQQGHFNSLPIYFINAFSKNRKKCPTFPAFRKI